jgi:hypothetical protein
MHYYILIHYPHKTSQNIMKIVQPRENRVQDADQNKVDVTD